MKIEEIIEELVTYKEQIPKKALEEALKKKEEITQQVFVKKELPKLERKLVSCGYSDGAKFVFENGYWAMIRFSGNENVVRIFSEAENEKACLKDIEKLEDFIGVKERQ